MRIILDMQGVQTESRFRGIGRYTLAHAQAIVRNSGEHEVILALNGLFPDTVEPIRSAFVGLLPMENIHVWQVPGPVMGIHSDNDWRREVAELIREAFLASLNPSIIHISSLFEGFGDNGVTSIGHFDQTTPVSVTLLDLIPLLNPEIYLKRTPRYEKCYLDKVQDIKQASIFLAISDSSKQEGISHLKIPENIVFNISAATNANFQPIYVEEALAVELRHKLELSRPFILYTGGSDERKNLPRLIQAYAALSSPLRLSHQLLLAGRMEKEYIEQLKHQAKVLGLKEDELRFTGYVTDNELIQLYNLCKLFVFPSWHEGFGLPALEAMACGAAVIGANTTSLPEVIGMDEAMFDPFSVSAISSKMSQALEDDVFRAKLSEHGLNQAKKFAWDQSALRAIAAFEQCAVVQSIKPVSWEEIIKQQEYADKQLIKAIANVPQVLPRPSESDLMEVAKCIANNRIKSDRIVRAQHLPKSIVWRVEGPFDSSYSLALLNRETARALEVQGHHVVLHSTEGPGDFNPSTKFLNANPDLKILHDRSQEISAEQANVTSRNLYPPRVKDMKGRLNFLHHYAWEESGFRHDWVESFNEHLQGVTCLSSHVEKILIDHGVNVPMSVSGCGVDHWERIKADNKFQLNAKTFRFLHVSSCFPRKGADLMLEAYGLIFTNKDDVTLIIKTFPNPHNKIYTWLAKAKAERQDFPDVLIIEDNLDEPKLKALYEQCHVLVAPSKAEGFGLPMAEAMLSGLAVITTGWGGQMDFCNEQTAWLIDYSFETTQTHFGLFDSVWARPDIGDLARTMRDVYDTKPIVRDERATKGKELLLNNFRWSDVATRLVQSAKKWAEMPPVVQPRVAWMTSWNTRCGIATYSAHLLENIPADVTVLASRSDLLTKIDEPYVRRCWDAGEEESLKELAGIINEDKFDTLIIQFNYGFFNFEKFINFLEVQLDAGRVVVLTMHATIDPISAPHKRLAKLKSILVRCHRILVHTPSDLNRLKGLGLVENVTLFPHGIRDYEQASKESLKLNTYQQKELSIASYGFFLPHKGLLELIESVALLHQSGKKVHLKMLNAEYPVQESAALIQQAKKQIKFFGLADWVELSTEFLPDDESMALLTKADLIVFPYQLTSESSSAAVRNGLACGKPVAVTPLPIFDDVAAAVLTLPGLTPEQIARGIGQILDDIINDSEVMRLKKEEAERWCAEHRYSILGRRFYGMLQGLISIRY